MISSYFGFILGKREIISPYDAGGTNIYVGNRADGYKRGRPLPVIPRIRPRVTRGTHMNRVPHGGVLRQ